MGGIALLALRDLPDDLIDLPVRCQPDAGTSFFSGYQ